MTRINTNIASLRGLRNLQKSNSLLDKSLQRLSTGLKINSGKDNPAGLIASETLRSQISTIEQSIKNSNRANVVINTAESALGEVSSLLNQVRSLVQEGLNDGALSQAEIEANQSQIDAALSAINRISANTTFAGDKLIDGSKAFTTTQTAADAAKLDDFEVNAAVFTGNATIVVDATVTTAASQGQLFYKGIGGGLASKTVLEVAGADGTDVVFLGAGSNIANIDTAIDALSDSTGVVSSLTAAVYGSKTIASSASNDDLIFTDVRTTNDDNAQNITQVLKVEIVVRSSGTALAVTSSSTTAELKLTVTLGTSAANAVTSTASDVKALLGASANSSDFVSVTFEGTGVGTIDASNAGAVAPQSITSGAVDGFLTFKSKDFGSKEFVGIKVLQGTLATKKTSVAGVVSDRELGVDIAVRINGQAAQGSGLKAKLTSSLLETSLSFKSTNNTVGTNSKLTITGGGALFQIGQEVAPSGQVGLGIEAVNTARLGGVGGKLFELASGGGKSLLDVSPTTPGKQLVDIVEQAIDRVSRLRGRLGSLQKNIIETNISTLGVALESVADARSQILDTDFAEETSNLTKAQILSQSGISVLAIANQTPSQVLSLLG